MQSNENQDTQATPPQEKRFSRRGLLQGLSGTQQAALAGGIGIALASRAAAHQVAQAQLLPAFMVQVYLRGGADGLSLLAPYLDADYQANRFETRLYAPGQGPTAAQEVIPLAGSLGGTSFGIPQALGELGQIYTDGKLAFIHAVGNVGGSQSHFAAQDVSEYGAGVNPITLPVTGWIARHLNTKLDHLLNPHPRFRAMTYGPIGNISHRGTQFSTPVADPTVYDFPNRVGTITRPADLKTFYDNPGVAFREAFNTTQAAIDDLAAVNYNPQGSSYPLTPFGIQMRHAAQISKKTDVEVVNIDFGGWDTHTNQGVYAGGPTGSNMHDNMAALAGGLRAFYNDMKNSPRSFVVLVTTEFGRSVLENANDGTDHGKGGVAMVMGSNVNGGQIYGSWPGLAPAQLDDRDVMVTTDIRDVLYEITDKALLNSSAAGVFQSVNPNYVLNQLGLF